MLRIGRHGPKHSRDTVARSFVDAAPWASLTRTMRLFANRAMSWLERTADGESSQVEGRIAAWRNSPAAMTSSSVGNTPGNPIVEEERGIGRRLAPRHRLSRATPRQTMARSAVSRTNGENLPSSLPRWTWVVREMT